MSRRRANITRTITTTVATVMTLDIESKEVTENVYELPYKYNSDADILADVTRIYGTDTVKPVSIVDSQQIVATYSVSCEDFMRIAERVIATNSEDSEDETEDREE